MHRNRNVFFIYSLDEKKSEIVDLNQVSDLKATMTTGNELFQNGNQVLLPEMVFVYIFFYWIIGQTKNYFK